MTYCISQLYAEQEEQTNLTTEKYFSGKKASEKTPWAFTLAEKILRSAEEQGLSEIVLTYNYLVNPAVSVHGMVPLAMTVMVKQALDTHNSIPSRIVVLVNDFVKLRCLAPLHRPVESLKPFRDHPVSLVPSPCPNPDKPNASFASYYAEQFQNSLLELGNNLEWYFLSEKYFSGELNEHLLQVLQSYSEVNLMLLNKERTASSEAFLPISPSTGKFLTKAVVRYMPECGTLICQDVNEELFETEVTNGKCAIECKILRSIAWDFCKSQFEIMRFTSTASWSVSQQASNYFGWNLPETEVLHSEPRMTTKNLAYLTTKRIKIQEWRKYAPIQSFYNYIVTKGFNIRDLILVDIPWVTDLYIALLERRGCKKVGSSIWQAHLGNPPLNVYGGLRYETLINLICILGIESQAALWEKITEFNPNLWPGQSPVLDDFVSGVWAFHLEVDVRARQLRIPSAHEAQALLSLSKSLKPGLSENYFQRLVIDCCQVPFTHSHKIWFRNLNAVLYGRTKGPKLFDLAKMLSFPGLIKLLEDRAYTC